MEPRLYVLLPVWNVLVILVDVSPEENDVYLRVLHPPDQHRDQLVQVWRHHLLADWLLRQTEPELAGLQCHTLVLVLQTTKS